MAVYKHYQYTYKGIKLDPYRLARIYKDANWSHEQFHAIKKLMRAGESVKSLTQDVKEVRATLDRWLEIIEDDALDADSQAQKNPDA